MTKEKVINILESLLKGNNSSLEKVISGYNHFPECIDLKNYNILTFSHMHETKTYLSAVMEELKSLEYFNSMVLKKRDKYGFFRWEPGFKFRDDNGKVYSVIKIKDMITGKYLNLESLEGSTLKEAGFSEEQIKNLTCENKGWEMNMASDNEKNIIKLTNLFVKKSSIDKFDDNGNITIETEEEKALRCPWPDAYEIPVLIVGGEIEKIRERIKGFVPVKLFKHQSKGGEYSFIIDEKYSLLKKLKEFDRIFELGFKEEVCLANIPFIKRYVNE